MYHRGTSGGRTAGSCSGDAEQTQTLVADAVQTHIGHGEESRQRTTRFRWVYKVHVNQQIVLSYYLLVSSGNQNTKIFAHELTIT